MDCSVLFLYELLFFSCFINHGLQNNLVFSYYGSIKEINLNTGEISLLLNNLQSNIHSLSYDYTAEYIYFTRGGKNDILRWVYYTIPDSHRKIKRSRLNGTDIQTLVDVTSGYLYGLGIDLNLNRIYWMEYNGDLKSSFYNGSNVLTVVSTNFTDQVIGVNVYGNTVYCALGIKLIRIRITRTPTSTIIHSELMGPQNRWRTFLSKQT